MSRKTGSQRRLSRQKNQISKDKKRIEKLNKRLEYLNLNREDLLSRSTRHSNRYRKQFKSLLNRKRLLTSKTASREALLANKKAGYQNQEAIDAEQDRLWGDYIDRDMKETAQESLKLQVDAKKAKTQVPPDKTFQNKISTTSPAKAIKKEQTIYEDEHPLSDPDYNPESTLRNQNKQLGREEWLKKTANSPAAKAGLSDDQRWKAQQNYRKFKKDNNRGRLGIGLFGL